MYRLFTTLLALLLWVVPFTQAIEYRQTGIENILSDDMDEQLTARQLKIASIAANTASGNLETLRDELQAGLEAGLTVNEINEVLIQMYAYCGFPRSLQGINTFMALIGERKERGIKDETGTEPVRVTASDKYTKGKETLRQLTGVTETAPSGANAFAPGIDVFLKEHLFADIFGRGVLDYSDREIATVAALTTLTGVDPMLASHLNMAMNTGLTPGFLNELLNSLRPFAGTEQVDNALGILKEVVQNKKQ